MRKTFVEEGLVNHVREKYEKKKNSFQIGSSLVLQVKFQKQNKSDQKTLVYYYE